MAAGRAPDLIVFYGSLMEGLTLPGKPDLGALGARRVGACTIPAALWDTGLGYPALTRAGDPAAGTVHGELWALADPSRALAPLDAFEGVRPGDDAASEYLRVRVRCLDPAGTEAWVYVWNGPLDGLERIPGGSWREHLAATGERTGS